MRRIVLVVTLALAGGVAPARADDTAARARAAQLLDEGVSLYSAKQFRDALAKFEQAYDAFASPKILFNIAGALEQLGREAEAAQTYDRFLATSGDADPERVSAARQALAGLDRRLARLRLDPRPGGALTLDGLAVESTDRAIYVAPGRHAIQATLDGTQRTTTIDVAAGEQRTIDLRTAQSVQPVAATARPTAQTVTVRTHRTWTWVSSGAAVALLAGGVIAGRSADAAFERYQQATTIEAWEAERATSKQRALIANACFVGAGAAALAAGVLFFVEPRERQVIVTASSGSVGAAYVGRF
ncbi:MAG TPA: hypothetical protein VFQ53_31665 [Kofleriaceae bacterium]|nr:hypothetical protein [Kofleriaceae bacterium]